MSNGKLYVTDAGSDNAVKKKSNYLSIAFRGLITLYLDNILRQLLLFSSDNIYYGK